MISHFITLDYQESSHLISPYMTVVLSSMAHITVNGILHGMLSLALFYLLILGLQPRDKAAMLGVNTIELFLEEFT